MKCPACKVVPLEHTESSGAPVTRRCASCSGRWLPFDAHRVWVESGAAARSRHPSADAPVVPASDPKPAKICPSCGRLMIKHRISMALPFKLDRCGLCGGVWFDSGEWEAVEAAGLLPRLNFLFNDTTQHRLSEQLARTQYEDRCRRIVGEEALERVRAFKHWLNTHPQHDTLRAYLDDRELTEE